jgi:hypothetical protein
MIKNLQHNEIKLVAGGRFLPGLTSRLNKFVGKPLEKVGQFLKHCAGVGKCDDCTDGKTQQKG